MTAVRHLPAWSRLLLVMVGLLAGSFVPASAGAQEPASRFVGFIAADEDGFLPTKVRAVGADGVVCGTADVLASGDALGFYDLSVAGDGVRAGCPGTGEVVTLVLLYGNVGDGVLTTPARPAIFVPGSIAVVSLTPGIEATGAGWMGAPPPAGGVALMVWTGPDEIPVELAAETLGFRVAGLYRYNSSLRRFDSYVPGGPAFVQTYAIVHSGDVVVVRAK